MRNFIVNEALALKEKHGTSSPTELCSALDICLIFCDLPDRINGFYFKKENKQGIVINENIPPESRDFFIAHELGHAVLHEKVNYMFICEKTNLVGGKFEKEADFFACCLIIDEPNLAEECITIGDFSAKYSVPDHAVLDWLETRKPRETVTV